MRKGFTLVELLAVIVIVGLLATIAYPSVMKIIKNSRDKAHNSQVKTIEKAAKEWGVEHPTLLPDNNQCPNTASCAIPVSKLIEEGYINVQTQDDTPVIKDPSGGSNLSEGYVNISFSCSTNQYTYAYISQIPGTSRCV